VLIVQINPLNRRKLPTTARIIRARLHEITFNAPLLAELRALEVLGAASRLRLHRIVMDSTADGSDLRSKLNTQYDYFDKLRWRGRRAARCFLETHFKEIGRRSTFHGDAPTAEVA